jgi:hypothetical protein
MADEQHDAKTEACTKEWAEGMRTTITQRSGVTLELEAALTRRNDAIDEIILDVATRPVGAETTDVELADFRADLDEFVAAKENLDKVKAEADESRANTPYPLFNPNCAAGQQAAEDVT